MRRNNSLSHVLLGAALTFGATQSLALQEMSDASMSKVQGAGLAFGLDDIRFQMAPTSYIEQIGGSPGLSTSFNRGDLRWFGFTMSGWSQDEVSTNQQTWAGSCSDGFNNMGCPISSAGIGDYANHDNPFVLRVFERQRVGLNAVGDDWVGSPVVNGVSTGGVNRTVLELLGPSNSQNFRWAFWGEIQASETDASGNITNVLGTLRNQNLILGKPATFLKPPSIAGTDEATNKIEGPILQLFQYRGERIDGGGELLSPDETFGLLYHSRLSGDYRFSVNQINDAVDGDPVPQFSNEEGLYFTNVNAYIPLGQLYYQSIVLDSVRPGPNLAGDGNFIIELTRIPNDSNAYNDFYSTAGQQGYQRANRNDRYYETHGYVEWGDYFPACQSGQNNCLPGSGSATPVRFSGPGYTSGTQTVTLPARTINALNFPGPICGSGRDAECEGYTGTAAAVTVGLTSPDINTPYTRQDVANAQGISFIGRNDGSTWWVRNNQNDSFIERDRDILLWRTRPLNYDCGFLCTEDWLQPSSPNPPDESSAPAVLTSISPRVEVNAINLGSARIQGLAIQHMKITSLGSAN